MPRITGATGVNRRLGGLGKDAIVAVGQALYVGGDAIKATAARSITEGSVSGKFHIASLPGEAPNADSHFLDRSIEVDQVAPLRVEVSANQPYAVPLEGGSSRMAARPFMGPAARAKKQEVVEGVVAAVNRVIKKGK